MNLNFAINTVFEQIQQVFQNVSFQANTFITDNLKHAELSFGNFARVTGSGVTALSHKSANHPAAGRNTGYPTLNVAIATTYKTASGWPQAGAVEVIADNFGYSELALFLPLLQQTTQAKQLVAWISPPNMPHLPSLKSYGIATENLQVVMASGATGYWAAERALRAGNASVLFYWPEPTVTAAQRNILQLTAHATGTLLFLMVPNDCTEVSNARMRLQVELPASMSAAGSQQTYATLADAISASSPSTAELLSATRAILFDPQPRKMATRKRSSNSTVPSLVSIGYASVNLETEQQSEIAAQNSTNHASNQAATQAGRQTDEQASRQPNSTVDTWVTLLAIRNETTANTTIAISLAALAEVEAMQGFDGEAPTESTLRTATQAAEAHTAVDAYRDASGTDKLFQKLEHTRVDVLRLNRIVSVTMPASGNINLKVSTPSRRASQLALHNIRRAAAPLLGQSVLRQQAKNSSKGGSNQAVNKSDCWLQNSNEGNRRRAALAQQQLV